MARQALITGGAGFIGSRVVARLLSAGWQVRVLDNFSTGSRENLQFAQRDVEILVADVRDRDACQKACRGVDCVFHLAAVASVAESVANPALSHEITLGGTLNLLLAARDQNVCRFVFSSSASVYGNIEIMPTNERQPLCPLSPYASDKACSEFYCRNFHSLFGIETVILRYFNVFGSRQNTTYAAVIPRFVEAALNDRNPIVYGDGHQSRDFVYVDNVADANLAAAVSEHAAGHTFNIAGGESTSLLGLLAILRQLTGASLLPKHLPAQAGEVRHSRADISHARQLLGYEPTLSLSEGLIRMLEADGGNRDKSMLRAVVA